MSRDALVVGINTYSYERLTALTAPAEDAEAIATEKRSQTNSQKKCEQGISWRYWEHLGVTSQVSSEQDYFISWGWGVRFRVGLST